MKVSDLVRRTAVALGLAISVSLLPATVSAAGCDGGVASTSVSGYEIFPGFPAGGGVTAGTTFVGWTNSGLCGPNWVSPRNGTGGYWAASVNYSGTAGVHVNTVSGSWWLRMPNRTVYFGQVLPNGGVTWPPGVPGCLVGGGAKVASFSIPLSVTGSFPPSTAHFGSFMGCLDDRPTTFPPKIWGEVTLTTTQSG